MVIVKYPNGAGSVYKLSDTKRRRPWVACVTAGYRSNGRAKRVIVGYYAKADEARAALVDYLKHPTSKIDITLGELYREWSPAHYRRISAGTVKVYESAWVHLKALENERVKDIRTGHLQNIIDNAVNMSRTGEKKPLSPGSVQKIGVLAGLLLDYAVQNDIVTINYNQFVKMPKTESSTRDAFTETELAVIEKSVGVVLGADALLVMCYTGFRLEEFLSLTRFSYNAQEQTLMGGNKTEAGKNRIVPIHPKIQRIVSDWAEVNGDALYCRKNGKRYNVNTFRAAIYYPATEAIGIRKLPPHCCRHTFATLLHKAGANTKDIQTLVGHASYAVTADIYTHVDVDGLRKAISEI